MNNNESKSEKDKRLDSVSHAISNKKIKSRDNELYFDSIYEDGKEYKLNALELHAIYKRSLNKIFDQMDTYCSQSEERNIIDETNIIINVSHIYYFSKLSKQYEAELLEKINHFLDWTDKNREGGSAELLSKYFEHEVMYGSDSLINEAIEFLLYNYEKGHISFEDLKQIQLFNFMPADAVFDLNKHGYLSKEQLRDLFTFDVKELARESNIENYEELSEGEKMAMKYNEIVNTNNMTKYKTRLLKLFSKDEMCSLYLKGYFSDKELKDAKPNKGDLLKLNTDEIIRINGNKNITQLTSRDLLGVYGTKFSTKDIIEFSNNGYVEPEKVITVLNMKSQEAVGEDILEERKEILKFYDAKMLLKLIADGKINNRFVETFQKELIANSSKEEIEDYYEQLRKDVNIISNNSKRDYTNNIIALYKNNFISGNALREDSLNFDDIFSLYASGDIEDEEVLRLYNDDLISLENICDLYKTDELLKLYVDGKVNSDILKSVPKEDAYVFLSTEMGSGNLTTKDIFDCFIRENIDIEQLKNILEDNKNEDNISEYIDENTDTDKISNLYTNFVISDDELGKLNKVGVINDENYEKIHELLEKDEFFEDLKNKKSIYIGGEEKTNSPVINPRKKKTIIFKEPDSKNKTTKISSKTIKDFYDELGAMKEKPTIEGNTALSGYSIIGFPDYDLVILENFDKPSNATYIMSFQQLLYYRNNNHKANMAFEIGSKSVLRNSDKVKVQNHTSGFGKNVVSAVKSMSKKAKERLSTDKNYKEIIDEYIEDIRDEYDRNK